MAKYLRYKGEFPSDNDVRWRVEIWQEADRAFVKVGALEFPYDTPLQLEWSAEDKEVPVLGSSATLTVVSPGDRTYEDLYTITAGNICMRVYRDDALCWSGCLDPEFYEEPYERASNYLVSLTFTDFGILDRLKYTLTGMRTLREIVTDAIARSGIVAGEIAGWRTTTLPGSDADILDAVAVRSDNFTDEEGEVLTLREALEGVLQPLGLRMIQRDGNIYIYDLNGLATAPGVDTRAIRWSGDSSKMSTDKVADKVKITFSPYAEGALATDTIEFAGEYRKRAVNPWPSTYYNAGTYSFYENLKPQVIVQPLPWSDATGEILRALHFSIHTTDQASGLKLCRAKYFHVEPLFNGPSACDGIACMFATGCIPRDGAKRGDYLIPPFPSYTDEKVYPGMVGEALHPESYYTNDNDALLAQMHEMSLPTLSASDAALTLLRIKLDMLFDCRYNPLSSDKDDNDDYALWEQRARFAFIPISLVLKGRSGRTYVYSNYEIARLPEGDPGNTLGFVLGHWQQVQPSDSKRKYAYLAYYSENDFDKDSGALHGWTTNRQCIGRCRKSLSKQLKDIDAGQYIPYPPEGGDLTFTIYKGINGYTSYESIVEPAAGVLGMAEPVEWLKGKTVAVVTWPDASLGNTGNPQVTFTEKGSGIYGAARWLLFKNPVVEIVEDGADLAEPGNDDVEYSGWLNPDAAEHIELDTICGTVAEAMPSARGLYFEASTGEAVKSMTRAGITDQPEKLLIGTLYSQYAARHTVLSGEVSMDTVAGSLARYTEANQDNRIFMIKGETQDVAADTSEATFVELSPDEYVAIKEAN